MTNLADLTTVLRTINDHHGHITIDLCQTTIPADEHAVFAAAARRLGFRVNPCADQDTTETATTIATDAHAQRHPSTA